MAITIDPATTYQTIDGVGASAAQAEQWTDADADFWFTTAGIGLSVNRMNINNAGILATAPWDTGTFGISPGYCLANTQKIAARGAKIVLMTQMCPAAWIESDGAGGSRLKDANYADFAAYITNALNQCTTAGITAYAVAPHNEVDHHDVYGKYFSPDEYWNFVHNFVKPAIAASTQPTVKILVADFAFWGSAPSYLAAFSSRGHSGDFDIISGHNYAGQPVNPNAGKPVWMTEISTLPMSPWNGSMADGVARAKDIHYAFVTQGLSSFQFCAVWALDWLNAYAGQNNAGLADLVSAGKTVAKRAWSFAHYGSRFIRPGDVRIAASGAPANVSVSAYKGANRRAVVLVNENGSATAVQLAGLDAPVLTPWITDATRNLVEQTQIAPSAGTFNYTLPAQSIVTLAYEVTAQDGDALAAASLAASQSGSYQPAARLTVAAAGPVVGGKVTLSGHRIPGSIVNVTVG
jgi:O-glycosyl hydrolase